jgi:hypothetical protein
VPCVGANLHGVGGYQHDVQQFFYELAIPLQGQKPKVRRFSF